MPSMERLLVCKSDGCGDVNISSSAIADVISTNGASTYYSDDDDSDDELGRMIYNSSETAKARARAAAEAANHTPSPSDSDLTTTSVSSNKRRSDSSSSTEGASTYYSDGDDTDDAIGYMIYMSSETAKARARSVAEAANNKPSPLDSETTTSVLSNKRKSNAVHDELQKKKNVRS